MTDAQLRHLAVSVRYIDQLLDDAARAGTDLPGIADELHRVRGDVSRFAEDLDLDLRAPEIEPLHAVRAQLAVASISVAEMRSRALRGYGPDALSRESSSLLEQDSPSF